MGNMKFLAGIVLGGITVASILCDDFRDSAKRFIEAAGRDLQKQLNGLEETKKENSNEN